MSLSRECPVRMRRLPDGQVAVRVSQAASEALVIRGGWQVWSSCVARLYADLCRKWCKPKRSGGGGPESLTGAERLALRRLAEQLESKL